MNTSLLLLQHMPPTHHGWGGGYLAILFWIGLFGLVILMIWYFFRRSRRSAGGPAKERESPREALDRRYAEGKIDEAEYRRRKAELQS